MSGDALPGSEPVAILSHEYWRRRLLSAPDVIGRWVRTRDQSYTIAGVLEAGFPELEAGSAPDLWLPMPAGESGNVLVALEPNIEPGQLELALIPVFEEFLKQQPADEARAESVWRLAPKLAVGDASMGLSASGLREQAFDPMTVVGAILFLLMITAGAALVPASRTTRIDPAAAIRQD